MAKKRPSPAAEPSLADRVNWGGTVTGRYMVCPASEHLHADPIACQIMLTSKKRRPYAVCACGTRAWVGPSVPLESLPDAEAVVRIPGILFAQREPLLQSPWLDEPAPRFVACPMSGVLHPEPLALQVKQGEKAFHTKCHACWTQIFLGKRWGPTHGFPAEVVRARGMGITG